MGNLISLPDNTSQCAPPGPPDQFLPPARSITTSPKSALLVENDEALLGFFRDWLGREGYGVRIASDTEEGLRLFRDCGPFNVVLINYFVPPRRDGVIDCLVHQVHGLRLATTIRGIDPWQGIIIVANAFGSAAEMSLPAEVMDIPLLLRIENGQLRGLLGTIEIERAIKTLNKEDLARLRCSAASLVRCLGPAARSRSWSELLWEAEYRTLVGAGDPKTGRHWNPAVSFVQHLSGAMKSIANAWRKEFTRERTFLMSELAIRDPEGLEHSPLDDIPSEDTPADELLIEREAGDRILAMFEEDSESTFVLRGWMEGRRKREILSTYALDEKKFVAAVNRILKRLSGENRGNDER
jgi:CheY-like chemotaxis protein